MAHARRDLLNNILKQPPSQSEENHDEFHLFVASCTLKRRRSSVRLRNISVLYCHHCLACLKSFLIAVCGPECIPVLEKICDDLRETLVTWDPNLKGTQADKAAKLANDCKLFGTVLLHGFSLASCLEHHKTFPCAFSPERLYRYLGQVLTETLHPEIPAGSPTKHRACCASKENHVRLYFPDIEENGRDIYIENGNQSGAKSWLCRC